MEGPAGRTRSDVKRPPSKSCGYLHSATRSSIWSLQAPGKPSIGTAAVASWVRRLEFPACPRPNPRSPLLPEPEAAGPYWATPNKALPK